MYLPNIYLLYQCLSGSCFPAILQLPEIGATQLRHVRGVGTCGSTMGESDLWGRFGRAQSTLREASPIKDAPLCQLRLCEEGQLKRKSEWSLDDNPSKQTL